jgi:hypothetical protein
MLYTDKSDFCLPKEQTFTERAIIGSLTRFSAQPRCLKEESYIECRLERFFISSACISFFDEKENGRCLSLKLVVLPQFS